MTDAVIFDAVRTPRGKGTKRGRLSNVKPMDLLLPLYHALVDRNNLKNVQIDDVILGCVSAVGEQGANIAKISALYAGWNDRIPGMTINRFCTSGLEACNLAALKVWSGGEELIVAGGVESMSRVPMGEDRGSWLSDSEVMKKVRAVHMGISADLIATIEGFRREDLDKFAYQSHLKAILATQDFHFKKSLIPIVNNMGQTILNYDELIRFETTLEKLRDLPPYFEALGSAGGDRIALSAYPQLKKINHLHHVGNSPGIADGAALVLIGSEIKGKSIGLRARAKIVSFGVASVDPVTMLTGSTDAARKALKKAGLSVSDIDLFEINESFSAPVLKFQRDLDVPIEKLNVNGGAIALGHPLGATGAVLLGTLLDELERRELRFGLVAMCGGAGLGVATILDRELRASS